MSVITPPIDDSGWDAFLHQPPVYATTAAEPDRGPAEVVTALPLPGPVDQVHLPGGSPAGQLLEAHGGRFYYTHRDPRALENHLDPVEAVELASFFDAYRNLYSAHLTPVLAHLTDLNVGVVQRHYQSRFLLSAYSPRYTRTTWHRFTTTATDLARTTSPPAVEGIPAGRDSKTKRRPLTGST